MLFNNIIFKTLPVAMAVAALVLALPAPEFGLAGRCPDQW